MAFMIPAFLSKPLAFISANWAKIKLAATVITIGVGVKGFMEAKALMAKGQDILGQKTAQGGKIPVIYGRRRVGSTVAFMHTADNRSKDLFVVYALSVGEIDQIELDTIEINGVSIKDSKVFRQGYYAGSDKISSGAGSLCDVTQIGNVQESNAGGSGTNPARRYRMVFNAHHGATDQTVDPMLNASIGTQWTANHKLRGIAYLACSFEYDSRGMFSSIPQVTVVCRGKKLYDPRKDGSISGGTGSHRYATPSSFEWSDNATLCLLDYMRDNQYGKGLAESDINLQTFQSAATTAEALKDTPDYDGSYASATFSGTSGTSFLNVDANTWDTLKVGGNLSVKDQSGNVQFEDNVIVDANRYQPYDTTAIYQAILKNPLTSTYSDEAGQALVKVERFHCNGVIDSNKNILENTQELLSNMRGILNYIDGKYEVTLEDTGSSSFTVTEDHIIGESGITINYEDKAKKANKVVVQFFNALKKYEMDTATVLHDASPNFTSDDGGEELELVIDFPHIVNKYVAYNMGKAILGRSRNQMTISFTAVPELYKVKVGDIITVAYSPVGFTGKLFRVEAMALQPNGLVAVQAVEYLDIYTWQAPPQENIDPLVNPVANFAVKPPTGLTFTDSGSSSTGRAFLTWSEPTDFPNHTYRVRIVDSSSNKLTNKIVDQEFVDLNYLPVGSNYVASVSSINSVGQESDEATLTFTVSTAPVATADIKDDAVTLSKAGADLVAAIDAGGASSTELIKATSAPSTRANGDALQAQDLWADTDDNNQIYVRNAANNGWDKARDSSLVTLYNSLSSTVTTQGTNIATAQSDIVTLTTDTSANATAITTLTATTGTNAAAISSEQTARTNADTALAADIATVSATAGNNTSSISTNTTAVADINGNASAGYVLKLNANGKVAQMVLGSNASSGSGATSIVSFLADTFKIDNDAGSSVSPFIVSGGSVFIDNARITNLSGTKIDVDTLNVKQFANTSSKIISHLTAGTKFDLGRDGQAYVQRTGTYTGSNAAFVPVTITNVRNNAGYVAIFSGVLGNVNGGRVQYSLNNSTWVDANGNTNIYWNAGTYRGYTYVYTGQITTLSTSQSTVYWRVYFSGGYNHTQLSLNVMMDNTR
tara:strand:+ start:3292 stop:6633 length:3342 start_codon:yes stop_codon:yes gene_type:complete